MLVIGLMSGTSADGIDAALVEWPDDASIRPFRLVAHREEPFDEVLQDRIHRLAAGRVPGASALRELAALDVELGERFAAAAHALAATAGVALGDIAAIASHGQTVAHHPEHRASLQIGDPSVIAERTGCRTVADFRARDLAAGGEGAPLAPFFHWAVFTDPSEARAALNLGGIANLTWLPAGGAPTDVTAFDVGPANALLDAALRHWTSGAERVDRAGARARAGSVSEAWLEHLLDDSFLRRQPPKSTGRERYGPDRAEALVDRWRAERGSLEDLLATLVAFGAEAVARACREFLPTLPARVLVGGGGVHNAALMEALGRALPESRFEPFDAAGVPAGAAEAMAFSLLGRNTVLGVPNHLPGCTGAQRQTLLGEIVPAGPGA